MVELGSTRINPPSDSFLQTPKLSQNPFKSPSTLTRSKGGDAKTRLTTIAGVGWSEKSLQFSRSPILHPSSTILISRPSPSTPPRRQSCLVRCRRHHQAPEAAGSYIRLRLLPIRPTPPGRIEGSSSPTVQQTKLPPFAQLQIAHSLLSWVLTPLHSFRRLIRSVLDSTKFEFC